MPHRTNNRNQIMASCKKFGVRKFFILADRLFDWSIT